MPSWLSLFVGLVAFVGSVNSAGGSDFATCSQQRECLKMSVTKLDTSCKAGATCSYRVCITVDWNLPDCNKAGTFSHTCRSFLPADACVDSFAPLFAMNIKNQSVAPLTECQVGSAGSVLYFSFKDGNGCGGASNAFLDLRGDPSTFNRASLQGGGLQAQCFPNPFTYIPPRSTSGTSTAFPQCSGEGNLGKECVWMVPLPDASQCGGCLYDSWSECSCPSGQSQGVKTQSLISGSCAQQVSAPCNCTVCEWSSWTKCANGLDTTTRWKRIAGSGATTADPSCPAPIKQELPCTTTPTATSTSSPTGTAFPSRSASPSSSQTTSSSVTQSATPTSYSTATASLTPTSTSTRSLSATSTGSRTPTPTSLQTLTSTATLSISTTSTRTCTATPPKTLQIWAGQHILVGNLTLSWNGFELVFDYVLNDGWKVSEMHIYIGTSPPSSSSPGLFPVPVDGLTATQQYTVRTELSMLGITCHDVTSLYIAVHGVVSGTSTETAWAWNKDPVTGADQSDAKLISTTGWGRYFTYWVNCNCGGSCVDASDWILYKPCDAPCKAATQTYKAVVLAGQIPCQPYRTEACAYMECPTCRENLMQQTLTASATITVGQVKFTWVGGTDNLIVAEVALQGTVTGVQRTVSAIRVWVGTSQPPLSIPYQSSQTGLKGSGTASMSITANKFGWNCSDPAISSLGKTSMTLAISVKYSEGKTNNLEVKGLWPGFYIECFCGYQALSREAGGTSGTGNEGSSPIWPTILAAVCGCLGGVLIAGGAFWCWSRKRVTIAETAFDVVPKDKPTPVFGTAAEVTPIISPNFRRTFSPASHLPLVDMDGDTSEPQV